MSPSRWVEITNAIGIVVKNLNAIFIDGGISQGERLVKLNRIAIQQMRILEEDTNRTLLK